MTSSTFSWDIERFQATPEAYKGAPDLSFRWQGSLQALQHQATSAQTALSTKESAPPKSQQNWSRPLWAHPISSLPKNTLIWPNLPSKGTNP